MTVRVLIDGESVIVADGVMFTAALIGLGRHGLRTHPTTGERRGAFCGMGVCFECEVGIDGRPAQRACLTRVRAGMHIETGGASPS